MKIIYNRFIPFKGYKAMNFFGILFVRGKSSDPIDEVTINHESIHTKQLKEMLWIFFYIWYGIEYLIVRFKAHCQGCAYHDISLEEEAHNNDNNLNYLSQRKHYAWWKYIKIGSYDIFRFKHKESDISNTELTPMTQERASNMVNNIMNYITSDWSDSGVKIQAIDKDGNNSIWFNLNIINIDGVQYYQGLDYGQSSRYLINRGGKSSFNSTESGFYELRVLGNLIINIKGINYSFDYMLYSKIDLIEKTVKSKLSLI